MPSDDAEPNSGEDPSEGGGSFEDAADVGARGGEETGDFGGASGVEEMGDDEDSVTTEDYPPASLPRETRTVRVKIPFLDTLCVWCMVTVWYFYTPVPTHTPLLPPPYVSRCYLLPTWSSVV